MSDNFIKNRESWLSSLPEKLTNLKKKQVEATNLMKSEKYSLAELQITSVNSLLGIQSELQVLADVSQAEVARRRIDPATLPNVSNEISATIRSSLPKKSEEQLLQSIAEINPRVVLNSKSLRNSTEFFKTRGQNPTTFISTFDTTKLDSLIAEHSLLTSVSKESLLADLRKGLGLLSPIHVSAPIYNPFDIEYLLEEQNIIGEQFRIIVKNRVIGYLEYGFAGNPTSIISSINNNINPLVYTLA